MSVLDNRCPPKPAITAAQEIMALESALNRAIRALPVNCYVMASVEYYDVGQTHKMPVVTLTVAQEY